MSRNDSRAEVCSTDTGKLLTWFRRERDRSNSASEACGLGSDLYVVPRLLSFYSQRVIFHDTSPPGLWRLLQTFHWDYPYRSGHKLRETQYDLRRASEAMRDMQR